MNRAKYEAEYDEGFDILEDTDDSFEESDDSDLEDEIEEILNQTLDPSRDLTWVGTDFDNAEGYEYDE